MNIFILSTDPATCAAYHCDQHVHKMILESAQMLSTVVHKRGLKMPQMQHLYKPTHEMHPCTLWLEKSNNNVIWLLALCEELQEVRETCHASARHGSLDTVHECAAVLAGDEYGKYMEGEQIPTPETWALAVPEQFKIIHDSKVVNHSRGAQLAYRDYYNHKNHSWGYTMTWKNRPIPWWMNK